MEVKAEGFIDLVRNDIVEVEARMRSSSIERHPHLGSALDQLLSSGGKRIRPTITLLIGGMVAADSDRLITLASAIELLHTATLIHDDLIDGSELRRGFPTLNSKLASGATVLTGDYIFARAAHLASMTESLDIVSDFALTLMTIVNGELTQLYLSRASLNTAEYYQRIYAKTGSLFEMAAKSPALLAECDAEVVETAGQIGCDFGIAFQIVDDVLDFVGATEITGKPVGSDLRSGLVTLPTLCYLDAEPDRRQQVERQLELQLSADELDQLIDDIKGSGAIDQALDQARSYVDSTLLRLATFADSPERAALFELSDYIIQRNH
jgi:geranylgeranyl pyrophosphate synthase